MPELGSMTPLQGGPFAPQSGAVPMGQQPAWAQPFNPAAFGSLFGGQLPGNLFSLLFHGGQTPGGLGAQSPTGLGPSPVRDLSSTLPSLFGGPQMGSDALSMLMQVFQHILGGSGGSPFSGTTDTGFAPKPPTPGLTFGMPSATPGPGTVPGPTGSPPILPPQGLMFGAPSRTGGAGVF